jgi:hypothetical protein
MKNWDELTEEEADKLDEYYSNHEVKAGPNLLKQGMQPGFTHDPGCIIKAVPTAARCLTAQPERLPSRSPQR